MTTTTDAGIDGSHITGLRTGRCTIADVERRTAELVDKIAQRRIITEMERMRTMIHPHDLEAAGYTSTPGNVAWVCEPT